jgi:hypothetical protein
LTHDLFAQPFEAARVPIAQQMLGVRGELPERARDAFAIEPGFRKPARARVNGPFARAEKIAHEPSVRDFLVELFRVFEGAPRRRSDT